ncbi:MAG: threonine--tRNA ligase [Acidimicrobiia bacterium]|nr:threonine--tRNA ligase [Acidimicrobiia bacterium]MDH5421246.1 threonine--tRNA ligase [Acidimicrobiia bacterium]
MSIHLLYPDGSSHSFEDGTTGLEVAESIGSRLAQAAVAVSVDGVEYDLSRALPSGSFSVITENSEAGRHIIRHSAAHIMAQAVLSLFPGSTFAIGPAIENGFYYDFEIGRGFTPDDIETIETRMAQIVAADQSFERFELSAGEALEVFADHKFKVEIVQSVDESEVDGTSGVISAYRNDEFVDLCRGPHLPSTGRLKAFKLTRAAGAYWRGDENNPQLARIYGTAWESKKALDDYLHRLEEAELRDHRKLGPELDLFSSPPELGSGLVLWHPKGGVIRKIMEDHSRRLHERFGFEFVFSPHLAKADLWETSGHLSFYAENMYPGIEMDGGQEYRVKPMSCPMHVLIYRSRGRSYRDLPVRLSELAAVYRNERSGVIHGMMRARGFTQDDSHTFCRRDQVDDELAMHLDFVLTWLRDFGFTEFEADLSTQPAKSVGEQELWTIAERSLEDALKLADIPYRVAEGDGAFYGPKIDVHIKDAIGRRWQMSTIQVDFALPENFGIDYVDAENQKQRPVMIHSAKAGSIERFFGVLLEHYAGAFPMWLAPVQAAVIPVADRHNDYANSVVDHLRSAGLRAEADLADATVGEKIRRAMTSKIPAVLVVGDDDVSNGTVGFRMRGLDEERGVELGDATGRLTSAAILPGEELPSGH